MAAPRCDKTLYVTLLKRRRLFHVLVFAIKRLADAANFLPRTERPFRTMRLAPWSLSHFPGWARDPAEHAVGLLVVNKLLGSGVPDNLPPQP